MMDPTCGIRKTKVGASGKEMAYLVPIFSMVKILLLTFGCFGLVGYACLQAKAQLWAEHHKLEEARQDALEFGHDAAVNLLRIGMELEVRFICARHVAFTSRKC